MAGGHGPGGRLSLLPLVRKHQELVELDLADLGQDFRDWFRPGFGESRLTTRRLLLLIEGMKDRGGSRFWSEIVGKDPLSHEATVGADIYGALAGKPHPLLTRREDRVKRQKLAEKKSRIAARERRRARWKNLR